MPRSALNRQNDHAAVLANARGLNRLSGKRRTLLHLNLSDFQVHSQVRGGGVEKAYHMRTQERLRDALAGEMIRRNHGIRARFQQMFLRIFLAGAGNDFQLRIQAARREHDVEIRGICGGSGHQAESPLDMDLAQRLFLGGIAHEHQPFVVKTRGLSFILLNDDERHWPALPVPAPHSVPTRPAPQIM